MPLSALPPPHAQASSACPSRATCTQVTTLHGANFKAKGTDYFASNDVCGASAVPSQTLAASVVGNGCTSGNFTQAKALCESVGARPARAPLPGRRIQSVQAFQRSAGISRVRSAAWTSRRWAIPCKMD